MRTRFPLLLCFIVGIVMLAQFFIPHAYSQELYRRVLEWMLAIGVFAAVLGLASLIRLHYDRIRRRSMNWPYSVVVFVGLFGMAAVGLIQGNLQPARKIVPTQTLEYRTGEYRLDGGQVTLSADSLAGRSLLKGDRVGVLLSNGRVATAKVVEIVTGREEGSQSGTVTVKVSRWKPAEPPTSGVGFRVVRPGVDVFLWLYRNVQVPLDATMFSLLAFFVASAAFRAFRARNVEATLLLLAACIVILGLTPPVIYAWNRVFGFFPGFPTAAKDWILEVPNMASRRAIFLGIGLGAIAQSFRIILGIERTYLGGGG